MKRIAIIGGGISGLSAAFFLEQRRCARVPVEYLLYESSGRFGGVIQTDRVDGCVVEAGPDSFLTEKPWASELCRALGIGDELIGSNDSGRRTYILQNKRLVRLPDGLAFTVPTRIVPAIFSPLFSVKTKLRIAGEWFHPRTVMGNDDSVAAFVERHYGKQMVDCLVDPLLSGVYGGDSRNLSLQAVLPRFAEMQAQNGSLGRALIERRKAAQKRSAKDLDPLFTTLTNGMQSLVDAVSQALPRPCLRSNTRVRTVSRKNGGWVVSSDGDTATFDCVIIAAPANAAAELLEGTAAALASELRTISYSSSMTVALGFDRKVRNQLPSGFGFLIPRSEGKRLIAVTFVHQKFIDRAPENRALIRCFLGGTRDEEVLGLSDTQILDIVRDELRETVGISADPLFHRVYRWPNAMAQYNVGHLERIARIESSRGQLPGIFLAGNAYGGIGVPDCVRSGRQAATDALAAMGLGEPVGTMGNL